MFHLDRLKGGEIAVIDIQKDYVAKKIKVGTGGNGSAIGLDVSPFWWFEK